MNSIKNCFALINTSSGTRQARNMFGSALQKYLDSAGITHHDCVVPSDKDFSAVFDKPLDRNKQPVDATIIVGGDGTVSSVVNMTAMTEHRAVAMRPAILVPAGTQNGVAASLGIMSADRSVSAFVAGRLERVPIWEVTIDGKVARYIIASVSFGACANVLSKSAWLEDAYDDFAIMPKLSSIRFSVATIMEVLRSPSRSVAHCKATLMVSDDSGASKEVPLYDCNEHSNPSVRLLVASQMPLQHRGYSITPLASFKRKTSDGKPRMAVTVAKGPMISRLRLLHLLWREAREGHILNEDGVAEYGSVKELSVEFLADTEVRLDGELLVANKGSTLTLKPTEQFFHILAP